jgi:hypothetical protein
MFKRSSVLAGVFAVAAGVALYESVPRQVEVTVISAGVVSGGPEETIEERYLVTDRGRVPVDRVPELHIPPAPGAEPQRATCVQSVNLFLHSYIHDCKLH